MKCELIASIIRALFNKSLTLIEERLMRVLATQDDSSTKAYFNYFAFD